MVQSWPEGFYDIGGLTFDEVYDRKKEFVNFVLHGMKNCTGMFKSFQDFCVRKEKDAKHHGNDCRDDLQTSEENKKAQ